MKYPDNETIISKHFHQTITLAIVTALIIVSKPTKNNQQNDMNFMKYMDLP